MAGFDHFKSEGLSKLRRVKYHDLEDLVYRMGSIHDESLDVLDIKYTKTASVGYTIPIEIYEISDISLMLKSLLPDGVKMIITFDFLRLKSNLSTNKTVPFSKKSFFYTLLGFTQSHSGVLGGIQGFVQLIPGPDKSDEPNNSTGIDKIHRKFDR